MSFVMSVLLSVLNSSAPTGRIFMKFCLIVARRIVESIKVIFRSDKNDGYFTCRQMYLNDSISRNSA